MSSRTAGRNKAVRLAWEREQELVRTGKGTRDWTKEQQQDILDPDKGKAYDEEVRAFEGQHMKSVAEYPEYRSNPDNIQFLTKAEHLEVHKGNWKNPTNWYYDPVTKEFTDFGEGELVPCKIIDLSEPIVKIDLSGQRDKTVEKDEVTKTSSTTFDQVSDFQKAKIGKIATKTASTPKPSGATKIPKAENGFIKGLKTVGRFIINHPIESIEIAGTIIVRGIELVSAFSGSRNKSGGSSTPSPGSGTTNSSKTDIATKVDDIVEKATRAENDVTGHKQRYHTKDGVIWKDKAPYHRGGKDS